MARITPDRAEESAGKKRVNRRAVMKAAGTAGAGLVALSASAGTAAAGDTPDQLYFCGCTQVTVTGLGSGSQIKVYLRATEEGGCATATVTSPQCEVGGTDPNLNHAFNYEASGGAAVLAVETPDGNIWCNPNNCAQKWLDELTCFSGITGTLRDHCTDFSNLDRPRDVFKSGCGAVCGDD